MDSIENIIKECEKGHRLQDIAREKNIPIAQLKEKLLELGGIRGKQILSKQLENKLEQDNISIADVIREYENGFKTKKDIANYFHISTYKLNLIIKEYEKINSTKIIREKHAENLENDPIIKEYREGKTIAEISKENKISIQSINNIIKEYPNNREIKIEHMQNSKNLLKQKQEIEKKTIPLEMICKYMRYGYKFNQVEKYIKSKGYIIRDKDKEMAQKIENSDFKLASEATINKIISKHPYSYEELNNIANKYGYKNIKKKNNNIKKQKKKKNKKQEKKKTKKTKKTEKEGEER